MNLRLIEHTRTIVPLDTQPLQIFVPYDQPGSLVEISDIVGDFPIVI
jgi:hypothetical protein